MTRETKIGLVVAGSFLGLVGVVLASKLREDDDLHAETALATAPQHARPPAKAPAPAAKPAAKPGPTEPAPLPPLDKVPKPEAGPVQTASAHETKAAEPGPEEKNSILDAHPLPSGKEKPEVVVPPPPISGSTGPAPVAPPDNNPPLPPPAAGPSLEPEKKEVKEKGPAAPEKTDPLPEPPKKKQEPLLGEKEKKNPLPTEEAGENQNGPKKEKNDEPDINALLVQQKKAAEKAEQQPAAEAENLVVKEAAPKKDDKKPENAPLPPLPPENKAGEPSGTNLPPKQDTTGLPVPPPVPETKQAEKNEHQPPPIGGVGPEIPPPVPTSENKEEKHPKKQEPLPPLNGGNGNGPGPAVPDVPPASNAKPPLPPLDPARKGTPLPQGIAVPMPPTPPEGAGPAAGGVPPVPPIPAPTGEVPAPPDKHKSGAAGSEPVREAPRSLPPLGTQPAVGSPPITVPVPPASSGQNAQSHVESFDLDMHVAAPTDTFPAISQRYYNSDRYARALLQFNRDYQQGGGDLRGESPALASGQTVLIPTREALEKRYAALIPTSLPAPTHTSSAPAATEASAPAVLGTPTPAVSPVVPAAAWSTPSVPTRPYKVEGANDTLYAIAKRELGDASRWHEIYRLNPGVAPEYPVPANTVLKLPAAAGAAGGKEGGPAPAKTDLPTRGRVGYTPPSLVDGPAGR